MTQILTLLFVYLLLFQISSILVLAGKDYYTLLGVSKTAGKREIKKAFRKLAVQYHPDRNKDEGAEAKFIEIANAYEVLTDSKKRKVYDLYGEEGLKENGNGGPSFDFGDFFSQERNTGFGFNFGNVFDLFGDEDETTDMDSGGFFDSFSPFGNMGGFGMPQGQPTGGGGGGEGRCKTVTEVHGNSRTSYTVCS